MPTYTAVFIPQDHLSDGERDQHEAAMFEHGFPAQFTLRVLRRRRYWIAPLPPCAWDPSLRVLDDHAEFLRRDAFDRQRWAELGSYGYARARDAVLRDGTWFYHPAALSAFGPSLAVPTFARALIRFLDRLKNGTIKPTVHIEGRRARPPVERVMSDGHRLRGPNWSEAEDQALRRWFSRHTIGEHAGKHAKLTDAQWKRVLEDELHGQRRKTDVLRRIKELNRLLRISLMVDGFLTRSGVARYKREALGESEVRVPRNRPRLGYHHFAEGN